MRQVQETLDIAEMLCTATSAAAFAASTCTGVGDKNEVDRVGVNAMRLALGHLPIKARVVVGEGEKDDAPMLAAGDVIGSGGIPLDIAVDPVEGTSLVAADLPGAISMIGAALAGTMFDPGSSYYMDKLVVGEACGGILDLDEPMDSVVRKIGRCYDLPPSRVRVVILDRPRNAERINGIARAGAEPVLIDQGDVGPAILSFLPEPEVHAVAGIGGTPEGIATACAALALGGEILGRMAPQRPDEVERVMSRFGPTLPVLETSDFVTGPTWFSATGITGGVLLGAAGTSSSSSIAISSSGPRRFSTPR